LPWILILADCLGFGLHSFPPLPACPFMAAAID
jgi:hypothetical protein